MRQESAPRIDLFPSTHWSLVDRAGHAADAARNQALGELVRRYLPALKSHLVFRKRFDPERADDVLQEFLLSKVIESELVSRADRQRGRFRNLLLVSVDRFAISQIRRGSAQKRFAKGSAPFDEEMDVPTDSPGPENAFDIAWARQLLSATLERMREQCEANGRSDIWGVFQARLLDPLLHEAEPVPYEQLVEQYQLASPAQASNLLITARRMFERALRSLIGEYEKDEAEIDAEIVDLHRALEKSRH